jgi:hypothetical protein
MLTWIDLFEAGKGSLKTLSRACRGPFGLRLSNSQKIGQGVEPGIKCKMRKLTDKIAYIFRS